MTNITRVSLLSRFVSLVSHFRLTCVSLLSLLCLAFASFFWALCFFFSSACLSWVSLVSRFRLTCVSLVSHLVSLVSHLGLAFVSLCLTCVSLLSHLCLTFASLVSHFVSLGSDLCLAFASLTLSRFGLAACWRHVVVGGVALAMGGGGVALDVLVQDLELAPAASRGGLPRRADEWRRGPDGAGGLGGGVRLAA